MRASPFVLGGQDRGTGAAPAGTAAAASPSDPLPPPQARDVWLDEGEPPSAGDAQAAAEGRRMHRGYRNRHGVDVHVGDDVMVLRDEAGSAAGLSEEASLAHFRCVRLWALHEDASGRRRADVFRWLRVGDDATSGYFARCPDAASHPKELFPLLPDEDDGGLETVDVSLIHHRILVRAVAQDTMAMEDRPPYQDPAPKHKIVAGKTGLQGARPSAEGFLCCWPCFLSRPDQFLTYRDWDVDGDEPGAPLDEAFEAPFNGLLEATCDAAKRGGLRSGDTGFASIAAHDAVGADVGWGGGGGSSSSDGAAGAVAPVVPAAPTVSAQPSAGGAAVAPLAAAAADDTASEVIHALCLSEEASDVPPLPPQPPQPKAADAEAEAEAAQPYNEVLSEGALRELAAEVLARGVEAESEVLACLAPILGVSMPEPPPPPPPQPSSPPPPPATQQTASSSQQSASPPQSQERTPTPTPTPPPGGADRVRVPLPRLDPGALKRGCSAAAAEHRRLVAVLNAELAACCGVPEAKRLRR